jgi:hypothetical protein
MKIKDLERSIGQYAGWVFTASHIHHFCCFGTLLGLIRDNGPIEGDSDVDLGIFYEDMDEKKIVKSMAKFGYGLDHKIANDHSSKPFYLSFKGRNLPDLCLFAWYKIGNIRYHTYDVHFEKKDVPSEYVFKGVPSHLLEDVFQFWPLGENKVQLTQHAFNIPVRYGTLFDYWYPDWKKPRKGVSTSPYIVKMKSCKKWGDKDYIESALAKSTNEYNELLKKL